MVPLPAPICSDPPISNYPQHSMNVTLKFPNACYVLNVINYSWLISCELSSPLRALGLLLADSALTVGRGKTFWRVGQDFFTKTTVTRELKRWNIVLNVGNEPSLRGLQTGRWPKFGSYGKNCFFWGKKTRFRAQKNINFLVLVLVLATTRKSCSKKKVPFSKINICLLRNVECF